MRCFIDAIGKLVFCLLVSTGRSDLQHGSLPGSTQVSVLLLVDASAGSEVYKLKDTVPQIRPPISGSAWKRATGVSEVLSCLMATVNLCFPPRSSRPGRPPKRLQSVTEGGTHHMLSHSGLVHAGIMPPAGDHPSLIMHIQHKLFIHDPKWDKEIMSHRCTKVFHCHQSIEHLLLNDWHLECKWSAILVQFKCFLEKVSPWFYAQNWPETKSCHKAFKEMYAHVI